MILKILPIEIILDLKLKIIQNVMKGKCFKILSRIVTSTLTFKRRITSIYVFKQRLLSLSFGQFPVNFRI